MILRWVLLCLFVAFTISLRLTPVAANWSPVLALALFCGARFQAASWAWLMPMAALLITDVFLGFYSTMIFVYGAVFLIIALGRLLKTRVRPATLILSSLVASILFFLITNLGVWLEGSLYPQTLDGLRACFEAAIPFFRNTLTSTVLFSFVLFGVWALVEKRLPALQKVS